MFWFNRKPYPRVVTDWLTQTSRKTWVIFSFRKGLQMPQELVRSEFVWDWRSLTTQPAQDI